MTRTPIFQFKKERKKEKRISSVGPTPTACAFVCEISVTVLNCFIFFANTHSFAYLNHELNWFILTSQWQHSPQGSHYFPGVP